LRLLAFLSTKFYPYLVDLKGPSGSFWLLFAATSFIGAVFVLFKVPETKNRRLESILREMNEDPPEETKLTQPQTEIPWTDISK
jgi:hypothetical protein